MRLFALLAFSFGCGCGAATGIPADGRTSDASTRDTSTSPDGTLPSPDAGVDADATLPPPDAAMDSGPDASTDAEEDTSGETVTCATGGFGTTPISEATCFAGQTCVPDVGCLNSAAPGLPPAQPCGVIACATECECAPGVGAFCNCANLP